MLCRWTDVNIPKQPTPCFITLRGEQASDCSTSCEEAAGVLELRADLIGNVEERTTRMAAFRSWVPDALDDRSPIFVVRLGDQYIECR